MNITKNLAFLTLSSLVIGAGSEQDDAPKESRLVRPATDLKSPSGVEFLKSSEAACPAELLHAEPSLDTYVLNDGFLDTVQTIEDLERFLKKAILKSKANSKSNPSPIVLLDKDHTSSKINMFKNNIQAYLSENHGKLGVKLLMEGVTGLGKDVHHLESLENESVLAFTAPIICLHTELYNKVMPLTIAYKLVDDRGTRHTVNTCVTALKNYFIGNSKIGEEVTLKVLNFVAQNQLSEHSKDFIFQTINAQQYTDQNSQNSIFSVLEEYPDAHVHFKKIAATIIRNGLKSPQVEDVLEDLNFFEIPSLIEQYIENITLENYIKIQKALDFEFRSKLYADKVKQFQAENPDVTPIVIMGALHSEDFGNYYRT